MRGFAHLHLHLRVQEVICHCRDWKLLVLYDRNPVATWVDGRVALLGDAAHPTLQYTAQGACMALEDAVCLSHEMAARPDNPAAALAAYRQRRVLRTARIQLMSRTVGDHVHHPAGAHAKLRNVVMSARSDAEWYDTLALFCGGTGLDGGGGAASVDGRRRAATPAP